MEAKHHIAFNFGLRHNEVDNVDPGKHIPYQAVHDTWVREVVAPKVDKEENSAYCCEREVDSIQVPQHLV